MFYKIAVRFVIILLVLLAITYTSTSILLAKQLSHSNGLSLEEEKQWAIKNGVWTDPQDYNTEEYTVKGKDDYVLHCVLVYSDETENTNKYIIISHGYGSNRYGAAKYLPIYISLGYKCIIYDLRGHGENAKSVCTVGNFESQDLIKLIDDTYSRYGEDIYLGLHGESMGSSTSLSALADKPKVQFVVADCGFTNLYDLVKIQFENRKIGSVLPGTDCAMKIMYHYSMKETHAIDALQDNDVPICFIHGKNDDFISCRNSEQMNEKTSGYSELHLIDNAGHAESRRVLGVQEYTKIVEDFFEKISEKDK